MDGTQVDERMALRTAATNVTQVVRARSLIPVNAALNGFSLNSCHTNYSPK